MELKDYLQILWNRKRIVFITAMVTWVVVAAGTFIATPVYSACTIIRIASNTVAADSYSDYVYSERLLNTYTRIATSKPVLDEMVNRLNLDVPPRVEVETLPNTELIQISVEGGTPALAAEAANTLAGLLVEQGKAHYSGGRKSTPAILSEQLFLVEEGLIQARRELDRLLAEDPEDTRAIEDARQALNLQQGIYGDLLEQYEQAMVREAIQDNMISIVEPAIPPTLPSRPHPMLNLILGFLAGLGGGLGLAFLVDHLAGVTTVNRQIESDRAKLAT